VRVGVFLGLGVDEEKSVNKIAMNAAAASAAALCAMAPSAFGQAAPACSSRVTRNNLIQCALSASLTVKAEQHDMRAAEGRKLAASSLLPSNPVVSVSAGRRMIPGGVQTTNWYASLAQEIEVAGQRGARRDAADAEIDARSLRIVSSQREVAAFAWSAFFDALAARAEQRLAVRLVAAAEGVSAAARARADQGLIAPVDADVADAAGVRVLQARLGADRRLAQAEATLISLLGLDPAQAPIAIEGELVPLAGVETVTKTVMTSVALHAHDKRPEVRALEAERKAFELRADAYRRTRIPNPTLSLFAQNDGFNERVFGLGLSIPIPVPGNVGRTYVGEVAEAEALALRAADDRERVRREIRLENVTAAQDFESRSQEIEAFTPARITRAEESLRSLVQAVEAGRLSVRDAVVAQQALIEFLQAEVAARRAWCLASVALARALGMLIEGGAP
jgi:cobalt-zinc-cadmium efflux system outer membrane protein